MTLLCSVVAFLRSLFFFFLFVSSFLVYKIFFRDVCRVPLMDVKKKAQYITMLPFSDYFLSIDFS